jgi:hypothetical protein
MISAIPIVVARHTLTAPELRKKQLIETIPAMRHGPSHIPLRTSIPSAKSSRLRISISLNFTIFAFVNQEDVR